MERMKEKRLQYPFPYDIQARKRNARTERWNANWRKRRSHLERKKRMIEFVRLWRETERQNVEKETANVKSLLEKVEETTQVPICVPDFLRSVGGKLREAEESLFLEDYDRVINLASESRKLIVEAIDRTRMILREKDQGRYLYGVIASNEERTFGEIGLNKSEVYSIPFRDVSALVSPSPMKEYELTEENAMKHQEVIRHIMYEHTVIPAEFGTVIKDEVILRNLITKSDSTIKECIKLVDGKVELGVKAILKRDQSLTPIERDVIAKDVLDSLRSSAEQLVEGTLFSNRLVLNASFLIEKRLVEKFSKEIERLQEKYADKLDLLYSGPWAPYNFVHIKIGAEGINFKHR